jgi:NinB protein
MTGQTIILYGERSRSEARRLIDLAPPRAIVNIRPEKRSNEQNDKMWAMLSDVARAKPEGRTLTTDAWKCLFMQSAGFKFVWEPGLGGEGVVPIGFKSSRLTKAEFGDLIECIYAYGAEHGVIWSEPMAERRAA